MTEREWLEGLRPEDQEVRFVNRVVARRSGVQVELYSPELSLARRVKNRRRAKRRAARSGLEHGRQRR